LYEDLVSNGYDQFKLIGVGKSEHMSSLDNWTNENNVPVCADQSENPSWNEWNAAQRDLFILDYEGNLVFHENISGGIPSNVESLVIDLIEQIPTDCDSNLMCGEAFTCCDGLLYPTTCCSENCDEPVDVCVECVDGEVNNDNPCNPMECWDGVWYEIIIDCAEWFGVPCEGGVYIPPEEDECCSECVLSGDINTDSSLNVLDVVSMVDIILSDSEYDVISTIDTTSRTFKLESVLISPDKTHSEQHSSSSGGI
jgi:hypothetical protein